MGDKHTCGAVPSSPLMLPLGDLPGPLGELYRKITYYEGKKNSSSELVLGQLVIHTQRGSP